MNRRRRLPGVATVEHGSTLVEVLVALAIAAIALTVFLAAIEAGLRGVASIQERTVATTVARSQMEAIKAAPWPGPYLPVSAPPGYVVGVSTGPGLVAGVQLVTVTVQRDGRSIMSLQGYKGQR